jgi:hypothetical protein
VVEITSGEVLVRTTNNTGARLGNDLVAAFAGGRVFLLEVLRGVAHELQVAAA